MRQLWHRELFLLVAAVALVTAVGCSHFHPPMNRTRTLLTAMAATWIVTFLRVGCSLYSIGQATRFLVHWFAYSAGPAAPPYVFQSPEGPRWRRLLIFVASYATWAFAILTLTEYGECRLSPATESGQWPTLTVFIKEVLLVNVWPFFLVSLSWITVILSVVAPVVHYFRLQCESNR
jgi:hypothetical protein